MIELIAGIGVGLLAGSGGSRQIDTCQELREQALATRKAGEDISKALDRHGISTEATGHREVVHYREVVWTTREGNLIRDISDLIKLIQSIHEEPRWGISRLRDELMMLNPYLQEDNPYQILERHGRLMCFEVHHFWNVVVGLKSYRHSYRCLPDGMAREIHNNPENWR